MRLVEFFAFSISGPKRASQLDQRVINTVLQGAKRAFSNKKAVYTVKKYLRRHQKHSGTVSVRHVAKDAQYVSMTDSLPGWTGITEFVPRPIAQKRLLDYIATNDPDSFLEQLDDYKNDVTVVGAALCEALRWGEPTEHCEYLAATIFELDRVAT